MHKQIRKNYLKLVLPVAAALLLLALLLLVLTHFGIRYAFVTSVPLESIPAGELNGACAQIKTTQIEGSFARLGHITQEEADSEGTEIDIIDRYCMVQMDDGKYIGVHVSGKKNLQNVEDMGDAIAEMGLDQISSMNFGLMRGTVNPMSDELYGHFASWADQYVPGTPGTAAFYEDNLYRYILDVDYYGPYHQGLTVFLTVVAAVLILAALVLLAVSFAGVWDAPVRRAAKAAGKGVLESEFAAGKDFAGKLRIAPTHIWCFQTFRTDILDTADVIWAYARSRRLEGGALTWYFVMKTTDGREYTAHLGQAANVQAAEEELKRLVSPLCTGYDKEKQQLYEKDIKTFCARVRKGTI